VDVPLPAAKPGSAFLSPKESVVLGVTLANDLTSTWPTTFAAGIREDADGDLIDGLMIWPHVPSEMTHASTPANKRYYSYPWISLNTRVTCVTLATRVINHLDGTVVDCGKVSGKVLRDKAPGQSTAAVEQHVYDCRHVASSGAGASADQTCGKAAWDAGTVCTQAEIDLLNQQTDQTTTTSNFEMVKLSGDPNAATPSCPSVKTALPAFP
jgi:hypothetical protein